MGGSTRWVKSLVGLGRKSDGNQHEKSTCAGKSGRWRLWRTSSSDFGALWRGGSGNRRSASAVSECSSVAGEMFGTVMAAVARARPREFRLLRQEWAAIRIQTAFRGLLARKALRSLKAVVRIQAIVRGWLVRKQAAVTLKCMQSLVRVQARVRAHRACLSTEEQQSKKNTQPSHPLLFSSSGPLQELVQNELRIHKKAENGWCNQKGTLDDIRAKLNMQKDAAIKRERQLAYSNSQQLKRSNSKRNSSPLSTRGDKDNNSTNQFCWIEKCRASKGWVDRPHGPYSDASECQSSKQHEKLPWKPREFALEMGAAKINNANSRISNTPLTIHNIKGRYWQNHSTSSSLESHCGKSVSSSSISTSKSNSSVFGHERGEVSSKPTMELPTKPVKANSSSCSSSHQSTIKKVFGESLHRNCSKSSTLKSKLGIYSSHSNSSISSCSKSSHPKGL